MGDFGAAPANSWLRADLLGEVDKRGAELSGAELLRLISACRDSPPLPLSQQSALSSLYICVEYKTKKGNTIDLEVIQMISLPMAVL